MTATASSTTTAKNMRRAKKAGRGSLFRERRRIVNRDHGVGSEVGRLRTVVLHRPGAELRRLTPRNNDDLLFDGVPWLERAQQEHDRFAATLRDDGAEVLYLHELLTEVLEVDAARAQLLESALRPETIGPTLAPALGEHLAALPAGELAEVLTAGMAREELPLHPGGLVEAMARPQDFVIGPLPNLLFTRDSAGGLRKRGGPPPPPPPRPPRREGPPRPP